MSGLRMIYLALAVWGAVHPMVWFVTFWREEGWSLSALVSSWYVNAGSTGLVLDLTIAAVALTVWIVAETWVRRNWLALVAVPATFCIGVSCGLPLYLFLRTRPVAIQP
ncbi:DUF2834 domain-containing protein [Psychromarinibacter sp. C21-152]|uniref:DUF2834 domain-containing protein n=1 Tax=Psychromarinibacter sediminicola TaxID=3033385 RepID=A0AAE3NPA2_9RHOB|nr:DUF2834 domain-containing protein [Psychromarinibacter sediminicola]MDF0601018.1 DUF2834 domain-containing protein [Psychromarinibacter sediminicola]